MKFWKTSQGSLYVSLDVPRCSCVTVCHTHSRTHTFFVLKTWRTHAWDRCILMGEYALARVVGKERVIRLDHQVLDHCPKHTGAPGCLQALARWPWIREAFLKGITYFFILKKDKASINSGSSLNGCMLSGAHLS